jgi:hypothetical protein
MSGTGSWEAWCCFEWFNWNSLAHGSMIVDVGGGIGSTTMLLAAALDEGGLGLKFMFQDRLVVVESEMFRTIGFSSHISSP